MLRETKTKSKKFRIRWSKVPRVLDPLNSSYGHFSHPAGHGRFKPKNTQTDSKSQFPGANVHFQQMLREAKTKSKKFRIRWSKVPRFLEPVKSGYGPFSHPAGHGRFKPKNTQNGNKSQFPGANVHFQQMLREAKTKSKKFRIRWSKVPRFLEPLNSSYGHVSHPAGHGHFKPKNTQTGNKSRFPGATCIFSKCCERQKRRARNSASDGQKYPAFWTP